MDRRTPDLRDTDTLDNVYRKQVAHLQRHAITSPLINVVVALLLAAALRSVAVREWLLTWVVLLVLVNVARIGLSLWRPTSANFLGWRRAYVAGALGAGTFWGAAAALLAPGQIVHQYLILLVAAGMTGGALPTLSVLGHAFTAYTLLVLVPQGVVLLLLGEPHHHLIVLFIAIFAAGMLYAARDVQRTFFEALVAQSRLESLAHEDPLTGVANRRRLNQRLEEEWRRAQRGRYPVSLLLVDVDEFKKYNDHYGHIQGDECLQQVAATLKSALPRATDLLARFGGEEFIVLLPLTHRQGAGVVARRIEQSFAELAIPHRLAPEHRVTVSIGGACCTPAAGAKPAVLIHHADQALYRAKTAGRNRTEWADEPPQTA